MEKLYYIISRLKTHLYTHLHKRRFCKWGKGALLSPTAFELKGCKHISIGNRTCIHEGVRLCTWGNGRIEIGGNCNLGILNHITSASYIKIGNSVLTGSNVLISDNSHGSSSLEQLKLPPLARPLSCKGNVIIEDNVWIGQNACILSGVTLGKGCVIGANSVVTHDIPPFSIAAGIPAHIIKNNSNKE